MSQPVNPEFIERYQQEYQKDPRSRVFAPLAEGYRKLGLIDEALKIAQAGVKIHPTFASGRVALAKILLDKNEPEAGIRELKEAVKLSPDNLLGHLLLGETWLKLRRPKEALKAYKMVLFLDPENEMADAAVKKWEFLTADEYADEAFAEIEMGKVISKDKKREIDRAISLADAFTIRNEPDRAYEILHATHQRLGDDAELDSRLSRLKKRLQIADQVAEPIQPVGTLQNHRKRNQMLIDRLQMLLRRIDSRTRPARS